MPSPPTAVSRAFGSTCLGVFIVALGVQPRCPIVVLASSDRLAHAVYESSGRLARLDASARSGARVARMSRRVDLPHGNAALATCHRLRACVEGTQRGIDDE